MQPLPGHRVDERQTVLHRAPAAAKLVALVVFAFGVVALPREWFAVYVALLLALVVTAAVARIRPISLLKRFSIDVPFVLFALLIPFIAIGERMTVMGVSVSIAGLWAAWAILAKASLCIFATIIVASTTDPRRIVLVLDDLRVPRELTSILGFMLRYLDVIVEESRRMHTARLARGFSRHSPGAWKTLASSVSALFIRAHSRGERVHLARLARGLGGPS